MAELRRDWRYVSQHATTTECLAFLETESLEQVTLEDVAWRLQDVDFAKRCLKAGSREAGAHVLVHDGVHP